MNAIHSDRDRREWHGESLMKQAAPQEIRTGDVNFLICCVPFIHMLLHGVQPGFCFRWSLTSSGSLPRSTVEKELITTMDIDSTGITSE